ncbi:MFS transporter [Streptomyces kunmingensis]|uniref:Multidrug efflux pump Tap n=1 Tax=Streptomyces kunmingensis TaxID=68225 RepID=A0ABU6CGA3_9ACTN|nr:MFS transporter [Streptomyces kunmingensis]MEB3963729.1 MFS transporter [Streptomyces kunmingensis]
MSVTDDRTAPADPRTKGPDPVPLRRNRDYLMLWSGAGLTLLGSRATSVAYPLLLIWSTGSAAAGAVAGFAAQLPQLLVQLPAGALVDRWNRRRTMLVCSAGCVLSTASVVAAVAAGEVHLAHLAAASFAEGSLMVCYRLAERACVRHVVPAAQLTAALSGNEARGRAAGLLGQPLGSAAFAAARWSPFLLGSVAHLLSLLAVLCVRTPFGARPRAARRRLGPEIAEGLRWLWRRRFLRRITLLISGSNVIFQALALLPAFVLYEDGLSPATVGVIAAISGAGGATGALCGGWGMRRFGLVALVRGALLVWALLVPALALTRSPLLLGALLAAMSLVGGAVSVAGGVHQVRTTPDSLQGRVNSALQLTGSGANALGALAGGVLLDSLGAGRTAVLLGAAMGALALVAVASALTRLLADEEQQQEPVEEAEEAEGERTS